MNINWKVRMKNKAFWLAFIPAILILIQQVLMLFGIHFDSTDLNGQLTSIVGTIFAVLSLLGIVNDPTTATLNDSEQAMTYQEPKR